MNVAYRWFLRLDLDDAVPDHSTIFQNRRRRFNGKSIFRKIFEKIVLLCIEKNLMEGKILLTDSSQRKLAPKDRLLGALSLCQKHNIPTDNIKRGIIAALDYIYEEEK